jgi:plasmid maintenance system killer protein
LLNLKGKLMTVSERLQKTEEVINKIHKEYFNHIKENEDIPRHIKINRDDYHLLLRYKEKNNPVSVHVTEMGIYTVRCFGILILIQDTW